MTLNDVTALILRYFTDSVNLEAAYITVFEYRLLLLAKTDSLGSTVSQPDKHQYVCMYVCMCFYAYVVARTDSCESVWRRVGGRCVGVYSNICVVAR